MKKLLKRFAIFLLIWFSVQSLFHFIYNPEGQDILKIYRQNPEFEQTLIGTWIFILVAFYIWKVRKLQKSLWWKLGNGILVWILGSILGSLMGAVIFGADAMGMILIALLFLISPLYEKEHRKE